MWWKKKPQHTLIESKFRVEQVNAQRSLELARTLRQESEDVLGAKLGESMERKRA